VAVLRGAMAPARFATPPARPMHACQNCRRQAMASMTQVGDTAHNMKAKALFAIFRDENVPSETRRKAEDDFYFLFINLAYSYAAKVCPVWGQNADDIKQTAGVALCVARDKWNPERGPFAVILHYSVQNHVRNWIRENEMIIRSHKTFQDHSQARQMNAGEATASDPIHVMSFDALLYASSLDEGKRY
jgi:hypothetical protein